MKMYKATKTSLPLKVNLNFFLEGRVLSSYFSSGTPLQVGVKSNYVENGRILLVDNVM